MTTKRMARRVTTKRPWCRGAFVLALGVASQLVGCVAAPVSDEAEMAAISQELGDGSVDGSAEDDTEVETMELIHDESRPNGLGLENGLGITTCVEVHICRYSKKMFYPRCTVICVPV